MPWYCCCCWWYDVNTDTHAELDQHLIQKLFNFFLLLTMLVYVIYKKLKILNLLVKNAKSSKTWGKFWTTLELNKNKKKNLKEITEKNQTFHLKFFFFFTFSYFLNSLPCRNLIDSKWCYTLPACSVLFLIFHFPSKKLFHFFYLKAILQQFQQPTTTTMMMMMTTTI